MAALGLVPVGNLTCKNEKVYPVVVVFNVCEIIGAGGCGAANVGVETVGVAFVLEPAIVNGCGGVIR